MRFITISAIIAFLLGQSGCIKISDETQRDIAAIAADKELVEAYARAAVTKGVLEDGERETARKLYDTATVKATTFLNVFEGELLQTGLGRTVDPEPLGQPADECQAALEAFRAYVGPRVDGWRDGTHSEDVLSTLVAVTAIIKGGVELADVVKDWWQKEAERSREAFLEYASKIKMTPWPELKPAEP